MVSINAAVAGLRCFGFALRLVFEAPAFVSGLDDLTVMCEAVEQRGCHLGIPEDRDPFAELKVGGDDDACPKRISGPSPPAPPRRGAQGAGRSISAGREIEPPGSFRNAINPLNGYVQPRLH